MVVLGGMARLNGSIIAATLITVVNFLLQDNLSGDLAALRLLIYALILIVVVLFNNSPAFAPIKEKLGIHKLLEKISFRRKPGTVTDDKADWNKIETKIPMDEVLGVDFRTDEATPAGDTEEKEEKNNGFN